MEKAPASAVKAVGRGPLAHALLLTALLGWAAPARSAGPERFNVVIGISARGMGKANRNDLTAAMRAWMHMLFKERNLAADARAEVFDSVEDLALALKQERVDVISVPTDEFVALERMAQLSGLYSTQVNGRFSDQYVLLVRRDRGWKSLAELRGEAVVVLDQPRAVLAPIWLDTELLRRRLPAFDRFFGKVVHADKPNLAIMPLFFRQAGATLITRTGFETACELNPQLGRDLVVLAASPELVATMSAYRANATSASVAMYRQEILRLGDSAPGRLILNLFQTDAVVEIKESELRGTRALLAEHTKLLAAAPRREARP